jgi:hypothetical protein
MNPSRDVEGTEFDWFAMDRNGCFALFATAGRGPVPESTRAAVDAHDSIGESVEVTGFGSAAVWDSYTRVGLYVYDWSDTQGLYVRAALPKAPLDSGLAERLSACPSLPKLEVSFAQAAALGPEWKPELGPGVERR